MSSTREPREPREPHGARVWFAVLGGIGAWMTHLVAESSLARQTCLSGDEWILHLLTVGLAGVTVVAMVLAARLRVADAPDLHFLGNFGLLVGAINLLLIVFEGALVFWVPTCT